MNRRSTLLALVLTLPATFALADVTLYKQDFESPVNFVNDGGDINIFRTVNDLYGDQPAGFRFAQPFTDETLLVGGTQAFGTGYKDPSGIAGKYVVAMLSDVQNDLLSLSFSLGSYRYLNFTLDISSIDLDRFGGPFVPQGGLAPVFAFSLFDNPSGTTGLSGNGVLLASGTAAGTVAPNKYTFDWTHVAVGLDAANSTNGNVTLQIDLLVGGYAAMDNFLIEASNAPVPEPHAWALLLTGLAALGRRCAAQASRNF
jgi:hypothetical protein